MSHLLVAPSTGFTTSGPETFKIATSDGKDVLNDVKVNSYAWTVKNELLVIAGSSVLIVPNLPDKGYSTVRKFDEGTLNQAKLDVNKKDGRIAFSVNGLPSIMDGDGKNFRLLTKNAASYGIGYVSPIWSSDGNWVIITTAFNEGGTISHGCYASFAVPANDPSKTYDLSLYSTDPSIIRLKREGMTDLCASGDNVIE